MDNDGNDDGGSNDEGAVVTATGRLGNERLAVSMLYQWVDPCN